jgi:uncharacterized protein
MGTFVITKSANGEFMFNLKADNSKVILTSEMYSAKVNCNAGIASVRINATVDDRYEKNAATNGELYFNLKSSNGQVIGTSQRYADASGRDSGITSVKTNAPDAGVDDQSA